MNNNIYEIRTCFFSKSAITAKIPIKKLYIYICVLKIFLAEVKNYQYKDYILQ